MPNSTLRFLLIIFACLSASKFSSGQSFTETSIASFPSEFYENIHWVDLDNDNDKDLILTSFNATKVYKNNSGSLTQWFAHNLPSRLRSALAIGDFNNDGFADVFLSGTADGGDMLSLPDAGIYLNNGSASFARMTTATFNALFFASADCADIDNDGDLDLLLSGYNKTRVAKTHLSINNGDGTFTELTTAGLPGVVGTYGSTSHFGDFDRDGDQDILLSGDNYIDNTPNRSLTRIYKNNGDLTFTEHPLTTTPLNGLSSWIDVNEDGQLDVFVSGLPTSFGEGKSILFTNNNGVFSAVTNLPFSTTHYSKHAWADFDNDGDKDLLASKFNDQSVEVYLNNGSSFTKVTDTNFPKLPTLSVGDYDNDGDPDITLTGYDFSSAINFVKTFRNNTNTVNAPPSTPTGVAVTVNGTSAQLSWTASTDNETSSSAIGYLIRIGAMSGSSSVSSPLISSTGYLRVEQTKGKVMSTSLPLKNLSNGTYFLSVAAVDESNKASLFSSEISFVISSASALPNAPGNVVLQNLNTAHIEITWIDRSSNEDNFVIQRSLNGTDFTTITTVNKNITKYVDKTASPETQYHYRIKAVNVTGDSEFSTAASITTRPLGLFTRLDGFDVPSNEVNFTVSTGLVDYNNDNNLDIFLLGSITKNQLFENNGDGTFTRVVSGELVNFLQQSRMAIWGDYNNDGFKDVFISTSSVNRLFKNNGNETFTEIVDPPFNENDGSDSNGAAWVDYDNDGFLDLSIVNYQAPTSLYHNNQDGTFSKVTQGPIVSDSENFANIAWVDYNNDGWQDAYAVNYSGNSVLYKNNGNGNFERVIDPVTISFSSALSSSWGDYDNDGDFDVFIGHNTNEPDAFFENNGNGSFTKKENVITQTNVQASSSSWGDFDNDGDLDLFTVSDKEKVLFSNTGSKNFEVIANEPLFSEHTYSGSTAFGDLNKDGFLDIVIGNYHAENMVLKNNKNNNHWIILQLRGTNTNRDAIGVKARIKAQGKWQTNFVSSQTGHLSQNSFDVEFGIGAATSIDTIMIEWPRKGTQILTNVAADQYLQVVEPNFPVAPVLKTVVNSANMKTISWDDLSNNETGFIVQRSIGTRLNFKTIKQVAANVIQTEDNVASESDSIFYRIAATVNVGTSSYSNVKGVLDPIKAPSSVVASWQNEKVEINWMDNSSVETSYDIERTNGGVVSSLTSAANTTKIIDASAEEFTTYTYRVRAKKDLLASSYSAEATLTSGLKKPSNVTLRFSANQIIIDWKDNSLKEAKYVIERSLGDNEHFISIADVQPNVQTYSDAGFQFDSPLYYRIKAVSGNTSSAYSEEVSLLVLGVGDAEVSATAYPNPATNFLTIDNDDSSITSIAITDSKGQKLECAKSKISNDIQIDVSTLKPGVYLLQIGKGKTLTTHRFIKQQ